MNEEAPGNMVESRGYNVGGGQRETAEEGWIRLTEFFLENVLLQETDIQILVLWVGHPRLGWSLTCPRATYPQGLQVREVGLESKGARYWSCWKLSLTPRW